MVSSPTLGGEALSVGHSRERCAERRRTFLKALLTGRWLSAHRVATCLVILARDIVGTWGTSGFKVATTNGPEIPQVWLEHLWNTKYGPRSGSVALRRRSVLRE